VVWDGGRADSDGWGRRPAVDLARRGGAGGMGASPVVASPRMALPPFPIPPVVLRAGIGLRRRMLDVADMMLPAEGALWDFAAGMQRTKLAGVLVTAGIADALGSHARDPAEVARELELDPEATLRGVVSGHGDREELLAEFIPVCDPALLASS
jgi:hypothetical protein